MIRMPKSPKSRLVVAGLVTALGASTVSYVGLKEGFSPKPYLDIANVPTDCFGETRGVRMDVRRDRATCEALLVDRLVEHEQGMRKCLKAPDALPGPAYQAFTSFTYNLGIGAFCGSSVARRANAGDLAGACDALLMWDKARVGGGALKRVRGLTIRRREERAMCRSGLGPG